MNQTQDAVVGQGATMAYLDESHPIREYRNNPLIGALPPIKDDRELVTLLRRGPEHYHPDLISLPAHLRVHAVRSIHEFFVGQNAHLQALREFDVMMRRSYVYRNPLDPKYRKQLVETHRHLTAGNLPPERYAHKSQLGMLLGGPPGTGKTTVAELAMAQYSPVIGHAYPWLDKSVLNFQQVPALLINMYQDASLKGFAVEFFEQLYAKVGDPDISAKRELIGAKCTANTAQPLICRAAVNYNIGVIVVDDTQNMVSHSGGHMKVLKYFIRLMNCVGVAVVLIGTDKTEELLNTDDSAARRFVSPVPRFVPFHLMPPGSAGLGPLEKFLSRLGRLRFVKTPCDLVALAPLIIELTGGIPDLIVKLWIFVQTRTFGRGLEVIDETALRSAAAALFGPIRSRLKELQGQKVDEPGIAKLKIEFENFFRSRMNSEADRLGATDAPYPKMVPPPIESLPETSESPTAPSPKKASGRSLPNPRQSLADAGLRS